MNDKQLEETGESRLVKMAHCRIEDVMTKSERSFHMPVLYSMVLDANVQMGRPPGSVTARRASDALVLGTTILDPLLLLEFTSSATSHGRDHAADLKALPFWLGLCDHTQVEALKSAPRLHRLDRAQRARCRSVARLGRTQTPVTPPDDRNRSRRGRRRQRHAGRHFWPSFHHIVTVFVQSLFEYPELIVLSVAWNADNTKISLKRLVRSKASPLMAATWLPPTETSEGIKQLLR